MGAKRDNDSVYFEKVPALSSLPAVQGMIFDTKEKQNTMSFFLFKGVMVAKPQPFDCHDQEVCGADIFQKLVPLVNVEMYRNSELYFVGLLYRTLI